MLGEDRRRLATAAALRIARELGIDARQPRILKDSNNTIVHLGPAPVVAKVGTSHFRDAKLESLARELAVATHLAERGSSIVGPAPDVHPGPHVRQDITLTLWRYVEPLRGAPVRPAETALALRAVHEDLNDFPGSLSPSPSSWKMPDDSSSRTGRRPSRLPIVGSCRASWTRCRPNSRPSRP